VSTINIRFWICGYTYDNCPHDSILIIINHQAKCQVLLNRNCWRKGYNIGRPTEFFWSWRRMQQQKRDNHHHMITRTSVSILHSMSFLWTRSPSFLYHFTTLAISRYWLIDGEIHSFMHSSWGAILLTPTITIHNLTVDSPM
jgi:hypothetical protein